MLVDTDIVRKGFSVLKAAIVNYFLSKGLFMNFSLAARLLFVCLLSSNNAFTKKPKLSFKKGDIKGSVTGKFDTSTVCDVHTSLLNKNLSEDKVFGTKTTVDLQFKLDTPYTSMTLAPRGRAMWGNNRQLRTEWTKVKTVDAYTSDHRHNIGPRMVWLREAWLELDLTNMFSMSIPKQTFTIGSFSFQLGKGISLGSAYSVSPSTLGFYSDSSVDQYAFGGKFSGTLQEDLLVYDLYGAVLENKSTSTSETFAQTQAQAFGKKDNPARGFGVVNWLLAARAQITPMKGENRKLMFEPYVLYNDAPEQTVEFSADANSKLTTLGMLVDFEWSRVEASFEVAFNSGRQKVKGWDRNIIQNINREGHSVFVYSDIYDTDPNRNAVTDANKVLYNTAFSAQRTAVNNVSRSTASNGQPITAGGVTVYNSLSRFRSPYENTYGGRMMVADIALWLYKKDLKIAAAAGVASGDRNPNTNLLDPNEPNIDGNYQGFIGLQELYRGNQVLSGFVMGAGKLTRPLSAPNTGTQFASVVDGFSNIIYAGTSLKYEPKAWERKFSLHPNLLAYWQQVATTKFDIATGLSSSDLADKFLGTEFNLFLKVGLIEDVEVSLSGAVFVPGAHYNDIKGKPFNAAQRKLLNTANRTSVSASTNLAVISNDPGYSFALGMSYKF